MGVYIKDLPMPKRCWECYYLKWTEAPEIYECEFTNRLVLEDDAEEKRHEDCPLVEVKEPHGRLIDADLLESNFNSFLYVCHDVTDAFDCALGKTPTVIEAHIN